MVRTFTEEMCIYRLVVKYPGREWEQFITYNRKDGAGWNQLKTAKTVCTAKRNLVAPEGRRPGMVYNDIVESGSRLCTRTFCDVVGERHEHKYERREYRRYQFPTGTEFKLQRALLEWKDVD